MNQEPKLVESGEPFEKAGLAHRVLQPEGNGPLPTAVLIHGRAGNEDVMWVFARSIPDNWLVVAPRAIKEDPDGGYSWHPRQADTWPSLSQFDEAATAISRFIQALPDLYQADPKQIYLMGFSQGAAAAYAAAIRQPGLVQGVAGLVGFVPVESEAALDSTPLKDLPIFMAAGKHDERIPYERAQQGAEVLKAAAAQLEYHEYDTGHKLNAQGMRDLTEWWQRR